MPLAIPLAAPAPVHSPIQIEIAEQEERPFELGDLLTREWMARNSSFLVSLAIHLLLFLLMSLILMHGTGKALIVFDMLTSPDIEERVIDGEVIGPPEDQAPSRVGLLKLPFGPFLALGALEYLLAGDAILSWYFGLLQR